MNKYIITFDSTKRFMSSGMLKRKPGHSPAFGVQADPYKVIKLRVAQCQQIYKQPLLYECLSDLPRQALAPAFFAL